MAKSKGGKGGKGGGRGGKGGGGDCGEEAERRTRHVAPRKARPITPAQLPKLYPDLSAVFDALTVSQMREACGLWSLAHEAVLVEFLYGTDYCRTMPLEFWHDHFRALEGIDNGADRLHAFSQWALSAFFDNVFGKREKWLAKLPPEIRKATVEFLKDDDDGRETVAAGSKGGKRRA